MSYEEILYEVEGGVLTITINRPEKLNAVTDTTLAELLDAFKQAKEDAAVRAVVLTGAGRGFCSGADLSAVQEHGGDTASFDYGEHLRATFNPLISAMREVPKPVIGAVNGVAAGAGMSIACACDFRIAAQSASFLQAFVKIGLIPDSGSTWLLPRLVGLTRATDLMLTGRKINAEEAFDWGLVNGVVPDMDLMSTVMDMAAGFAAGPTKAYALIKQGIEYAATSTLAQALDYEADLQVIAGHSADHAEGLMAFLEKRPPQYKGE